MKFAKMGEIGATLKVTIYRDIEYDVERLINALVQGYKRPNNALIFENSITELANPHFDPKDSQSSEFIEDFVDENDERCDFWTFQERCLPRDHSRRLNMCILSTRLHDSEEVEVPQDGDLDQEEQTVQDIAPDQKYSKANVCKSTKRSSELSLAGFSGTKRAHDGHILKKTPKTSNDKDSRIQRDHGKKARQKIASPYRKFSENDYAYVEEPLHHGILSAQNLGSTSKKVSAKLKYSKILNREKSASNKTTSVPPKVASVRVYDESRSSLEPNVGSRHNNQVPKTVSTAMKYSKIHNAVNSMSNVATPAKHGSSTTVFYPNPYNRQALKEVSLQQVPSSSISNDQRTLASIEVRDSLKLDPRRTKNISLHEKYSRSNQLLSQNFQYIGNSSLGLNNTNLHQTKPNDRSICVDGGSFKVPEQLIQKTKFSTHGLSIQERMKCLKIFGLKIDFSINFQHLEKISEIGSGGQACVDKYKYMGAYYAVKSYDIDTEYEYSIIREIAALEKIHHPNIIKIMGLSLSPNHYHILTEVAEGQTLDQLLSEVQSEIFSNAEKDTIGEQLTSAIAYLHQDLPNKLSIIHRDIKPSNVIVNPTKSGIKLIDFGLSTFEVSPVRLNKLTSGVDVIGGTVLYLSPNQVIYGKKATLKSDIWALGCTFVEMYSGNDVWTINYRFVMKQQVKAQMLEKKAPETVGIPGYLIEVVKKCFNWNETKRPEATEILAAYNNRPKCVE